MDALTIHSNRTGTEQAAAVAAWLGRDERWYVERNLLALLAEIGHWPAGLDASRYLSHSDERVRREAYRLLFQVPAQRERAVCAALADPDLRNLRQGVAAARESMPPAGVALVAQRLYDEALPTELRTGLVRALAGVRSPLALDALLRIATGGRTLFGGVKLSAAAPETVAAVRLLARDWGAHPRGAMELRARRVPLRARTQKYPTVPSANAPSTPSVM